MSTSTAAETATKIKELLKPTTLQIESIDAQRLDQLRRIFSNLILTEQLNLTAQKPSQAAQKWNMWLKKQHGNFIDQLCHVVRMGRKSGMRTFMGVIASSPMNDGNADRLNDGLVVKLLQALMDSYGDEGDGIAPEYMLELLQIEFCKYRDVQYFMMVSMKQLAKSLGGDELDGVKAENLLRVLMKIYIACDQDDLTPNDLKKDGSSSNYIFTPPIVEDGAEIENDEFDGEIVNSNIESDNDSEDEEPSPKKRRKVTVSKTKKVKLMSWQSVRQHRNALQQSTLAILQVSTIPARTMKRILQHMPVNILPHVSNPLRFADFCTRAYEVGGVTSLLALHSLFILMTQHGLEYPKFYLSLYNLIETELFYAKHRTRFFKLLVKCLTGSQMLPAYLVAAFCKRLCRCAINAPPSGSLFVIALVSNLIRKHGECACIIHREGDDMEDVYDADEKDPAKSRAIESCLWELNALEQHYHPAVSSMAKGCGMEDSKTLYHDLDQFLVHTYKSLFDQERQRGNNKRKIKIPLTFHKPKGLFTEGDIFDGIFDFSFSQV
jgi:U3 small nucleolar RNA-associated protein 19